MAKKPAASSTDTSISAPKKGASLTLIDVAKVAGVSPMTVSRALHRPARWTPNPVVCDSPRQVSRWLRSWDLSEEPLDMLVGFSHEKVGEETARHLLKKGYKRFSVVTIIDPRGLRRCSSLIAELKRQGIGEVPLEILAPPATL
ncbi:LacI family DNA-binding transcriptional regulator [Pseudomonas sp. MWU13-2100]|uniref:LacI family DNA-binding transcriptional regulator n=1 Tax=Pseudomonas sp. MWU13-2100 TaxID=2935075 RepID=UPI002010A928|nr:LacI family DNA-binding transcriptional regulator [Pseudomonas sp. MWU13-2100]